MGAIFISIIVLLCKKTSADLRLESHSTNDSFFCYMDYVISYYDGDKTAELYGTLGYEETEKYIYELPIDSAGELWLNRAPDELVYPGLTIYNLNGDYLVLSYMTDDMYHNRINCHMLDQLVYLNDDSYTADVIFSCYDQIRILYGNNNYVIVYHAPSNTYRYISINSGSVFNTVDSNINNNSGDYVVHIYENEGYIAIEKRSFLNEITIDKEIIIDKLNLVTE